jgi:hypothetical protein
MNKNSESSLSPGFRVGSVSGLASPVPGGSPVAGDALLSAIADRVNADIGSRVPVAGDAALFSADVVVQAFGLRIIEWWVTPLDGRPARPFTYAQAAFDRAERLAADSKGRVVDWTGGDK